MNELPSCPSWALAFCVSPAHSRLLGWGMEGLPCPGALRTQVLGGWPSAGLAEQGSQTAVTFWGCGDEKGSQLPASMAPPPLAPLLLSLCRNQKIPAQRREMGYFWHCGGKSKYLPSVQKYMLYERTDEELGRAQSPCWRGSCPSAVVLPPLRGPVAHMTTPGGHCSQTACDVALAGPEQSMIFIQTKSDRHGGGEGHGGGPSPGPRSLGSWGRGTSQLWAEGRRPPATLAPWFRKSLWNTSLTRLAGARTQGRLDGWVWSSWHWHFGGEQMSGLAEHQDRVLGHPPGLHPGPWCSLFPGPSPGPGLLSGCWMGGGVKKPVCSF